MTLLLGSFVVVDGKEAGAVKTGEACHMNGWGIDARAKEALNVASTRKKRTKSSSKITTKIKEPEKG
jgi:hypothetical protein